MWWGDSVLSVQAVCGVDDFVSHFSLILIIRRENFLSDSYLLKLLCFPRKTLWFCLLDTAKLGIDQVSLLVLASGKVRGKSPLANVSHTILPHCFCFVFTGSSGG